MSAQTIKAQKTARGMRTFLVIWGGQLFSMIGSGLTDFALGVWIYDQTGEATPFAMTILFGSLPSVLLAPIAGVAADRWNRRLIMILTDTGSALLTLLVVYILFFAEGGLQIWHIYGVALVGSSLGAFQRAAYMPSVTMLVPKEHFGRASGLMQTGQAVQGIIAPLLAGVLYVAIGLEGIVVIDFVTYFFAIGALLLVRIPQPKSTTVGEGGKGSMLKEAAFGWTYLIQRRPLLVMLFYYALVNFLLGIMSVLVTPLILSFSPASVLGAIQMVGSVGMLAGSLLMSTWGGPKRKMNGVYAFIALFSLGFFFMGLQNSAVLIGLGMFVLLFSLPLAAGSSQVIWMSKVEPDIQGRVFAVRGMLASAITPFAYLIAGPLADNVFGPLLSEGGALAASVGGWIGVGPERGIGLMLLLSGALMLVVTAAAYAYPRLRLIEDELPDVVPDSPEDQAEGAQHEGTGDHKPTASPA
jgi:DHA3 family macrolide efflux protein-like MFS transporter